MKKYIILTSAAVFLAACGVDTTGIKTDSSKIPKGNPNASVIVTEFSDFQCPACRVAYELVTKPLEQKYGDKVRFDLKQFPLPMHEYALQLAEASECAADQGKFWEFVDKVFEEQLKMDQEKPPRAVSADDIDKWEKDLGLDNDLFTRCTASHIKRKAVMAEFDEARAKNIEGTPTYLVNDTVVKTDPAELEKAIDAALQKQGGRAL